MIERAVLVGIGTLVGVLRAREREERPRRRRGMIRRVWDESGVAVPFPKAYESLDEALPLRPSEALEIILRGLEAFRQGADAHRDCVGVVATELTAGMAGAQRYQHVHGVWALAHWLGIDVDHGSVAARLRETHGHEASEDYTDRAMVDTAILISGGVGVVLTDQVH